MMERHEHDNPGRHDEADALFDANLRQFGSRIGPVPARSALTLAGTDAAPTTKRRPRWLAWGSAMAACIAAGVVIFSQPWGNSVQASTIISGLRTKEFGGVNILFDHVSSQGTTVDGVVRMRLKDPISIDRLDDPKAMESSARLGVAYGKFTLTSDGGPAGGAPSVIDAEGALTPGSGWMYVRASDAAARQLSEGNPMAGAMVEMAQHGMVLNVGGLDERFFEGLSAMVCPGSAQSGGLHTSVERTPDGHGKVSIGMQLGAPGNPSAEQFRRLIGLARMVLSGKARQSELEQMRSTLQNDFSQKSAVQTLGAGRFLLTTALPGPPEAAPGGTGAAGGTLRVLYEQSGGVRWAEMSNMPGATGTIRVEFESEPIDASLLAYERLVQTGTTNYLDLRVVMRMFMPPLLRAW